MSATLTESAECGRMKALLFGWLSRNPPPARFDLLPPEPCAVGTVADLPGAPGPQPWNGGITPGYERPRAAGEPVAVADLRALAAGVRAALASVYRQLDTMVAAIREVEDGLDAESRRARGECWELATWAAELQARLNDTPTGGPTHGDQGPGGGSGARGAGTEERDERRKAG